MCTEAGVYYDLCASGKITKITYRKASDTVLISGIEAPGCGSGWVLTNLTEDEHKKQMYASLLSAYFAGKTISLTRAGGRTSCVQWDGTWKSPITEMSLD